MSDPSVEQWQSAMELSTGARLRHALDANEELARQLEMATTAKIAAIKQLREAHEEIERLTARIARQPGQYHLTDKARAALAADPKEKP